MHSRIYIIEDSDIMREMLSVFISDLPNAVVCGVAATAEEALREIPATDPDLLLIDMSLPQMNGAELIGMVRDTRPGLRCLVLSGHGEAAYVERARAAGACGYVLKGNPYELREAVRAVLRGEEYFKKPVAATHARPDRRRPPEDL